MQQARAIHKREGRRRMRLPRLRAPLAGILLSLLVFLSPDLTLAPLNAGEPPRGGPTPIDLIGAKLPPPQVHPLDTADPIRPLAPVRGDPVAYAAALDAARAAASAHGIAFAAVRDGDLLWSGVSGRARDATTALSADDAFVIGSVTKTFVAAAILQLVEEGRLELDDTLRSRLPELRGFDRSITIRQLLDHTSGIADVFNDTTRRGLEEHPELAWAGADVLGSIHAPWYRPGEGWAYANTNYFLLGLIVERVTGSTLADELSRRFLGPMGLERTRLLTGAADDGGLLSPAWATIFWGSGAMSASAADLARWGDTLYGGELLQPSSLAAMEKVNDHDYGLGVQRIQLADAVGFGHTGLLNTYTSMLWHIPESDVTIAVLVNRSHVDLGAILTAHPNGGRSLLELAELP